MAELIPSAQLVTSFLVIAVIFNVMLGGTSYLILLERKLASWAQDRIGPNRVGLTFGFLPNNIHMFGLGQPLADGVKFLFKEDYNPGNVDRGLFMIAPVLAVVPASIAFAVIPWGGSFEIPAIASLGFEGATVSVAVANVNIGVIYLLATGALAVYGITIGAWASNNKYSFFGGIRGTAQMLSYEIPMGLCVLCVLLMVGSPHPTELVNQQVGYWFGVIPSWNIFQQPVIAVLFFTCILAESNRAPFDLAECEQELIGGFHTEYSSMKFALFFLGEYFHMITASAFFAVLFLGGWHLPILDYAIYGGAQPELSAGWLGILGVLLKVAVFLGKVALLVALMMWIRWTLPRFRYDQLMRLAWRGLIPITLTMLLTTGAFVYLEITGYLWIANIAMVFVTLAATQIIPADKDVNKRAPLVGSRFSPAVQD
ncbi:MAG: complex I subunit 1/NuoH family protein [Planctomycetota bacterium]|jgi:NADH-quinone oxidoreductase subunit H